jgi:mannosyltransferase OCH1-like enzyme
MFSVYTITSINVSKLKTNYISLYNASSDAINLKCIDSVNKIAKNVHIKSHERAEYKSIYGYVKDIDIHHQYNLTFSSVNNGVDIVIKKQNGYTFDQYDIDFDYSLNKTSKKNHYKKIINSRTAAKFTAPLKPLNIYKQLKNVYNKQKKQVSERLSSVPRIPYTIHQVWLGSKIPDKFKVIQESWLKHNPQWELILWTDQHINHNKELLNSSYNYKEKHISEIGNLYRQELYDSLSNYGAKSDVLRIEVLVRYGGLYIDTDFECLESFSILNDSYDFYTGIPPLGLNKFQVSNGLIGSIPNHSILKHYLSLMSHPREYQKYTQNLWSGASIIMATGPIAFTKAISAVIGKMDTKDIVFPPSYFYPLIPEDTQKALKAGQDLRLLPFYKEAFAVHYWATSWN